MTNESSETIGLKLVDRIRFVIIGDRDRDNFFSNQEIEVETLKGEKCKYRIVKEAGGKETEYFGKLAEIRIGRSGLGVDITLRNNSQDKEILYGQLYIGNENDLGIYIPNIISVE